MVSGGIPYSEIRRKLETVCCGGGSAVDKGSGFHCGKGRIRTVSAERICKSAYDSARGVFNYLPVSDKLLILILNGHPFKMRM